MVIGLLAKAIVGAFVAASGAVITALQNGAIGVNEWLTIAGSLLVGFGAVWAVPNMPDGVARYGKAIVSGLIAGIGAAGTAYLDRSFSTDEIVVIVVAVVTGLGLVAAAPNAPASTNFATRSVANS